MKKGTWEHSGIMEMLGILTGVRVTWVHAFVKLHFNICKFHLNLKILEEKKNMYLAITEVLGTKVD